MKSIDLEQIPEHFYSFKLSTRIVWCALYRAAAQSVMDCLQHYESLPARTETPEQAAALTQPTQVV
jgi:hypothetical protein